MTTSSGMERSKVCVKCGRNMRIDAFRMTRNRHGECRRKTCAACEDEARGTAKATTTTPTTPAPAKVNGSLEIAAGLGVRVSIEDSTLELEQDRADADGQVYTHTISLAPHEARQVIEFIERHVERQA